MNMAPEQQETRHKNTQDGSEIGTWSC